MSGIVLSAATLNLENGQRTDLLAYLVTQVAGIDVLLFQFPYTIHRAEERYAGDSFGAWIRSGWPLQGAWPAGFDAHVHLGAFRHGGDGFVQCFEDSPVASGVDSACGLDSRAAPGVQGFDGVVQLLGAVSQTHGLCGLATADMGVHPELRLDQVAEPLPGVFLIVNGRESAALDGEFGSHVRATQEIAKRPFVCGESLIAAPLDVLLPHSSASDIADPANAVTAPNTAPMRPMTAAIIVAPQASGLCRAIHGNPMLPALSPLRRNHEADVRHLESGGRGIDGGNDARLRRQMELLSGLAPSVVALQECKHWDRENLRVFHLTERLLGPHGYLGRSTHHGCHLAVFVRERDGLRVLSSGMSAGSLVARYRLRPGGGRRTLQLASCHFAPSSPERRLEEAEGFALVEERGLLIAGGDWNALPAGDPEPAGPMGGKHQRKLDRRAAEALDELGLLDVGAQMRDTTPTVGHASVLPYRCDRIYTSLPAEAITGYEVITTADGNLITGR